MVGATPQASWTSLAISSTTGSGSAPAAGSSACAKGDIGARLTQPSTPRPIAPMAVEIEGPTIVPSLMLISLSRDRSLADHSYCPASWRRVLVPSPDRHTLAARMANAAAKRGDYGKGCLSANACHKPPGQLPVGSTTRSGRDSSDID